MALSRGMTFLGLFLSACVLQSVEGARLMRTSKSMRMKLDSRHKADVAAMSIENALDILRHSNSTAPQLVSFVEASVRHHKRFNHSHLRKHAKGVPKPDAGADYGTGTQNAVVKINEMILETIMKMDEEELRCEARFEELEQLLTEIAEDLATFQVSGSEAAANKLDAYAAIADYEGFITTTNGELQSHKDKCLVETGDLHAQYKIILSDQGVMEKILNMTECSDTAYAKAGATLLECTNSKGKHFTKVRVKKALAEALAKLQHPKSRKVIDNQIVVEDVGADAGQMLLEEGHAHHTLRKVFHKRVIPKGLYGNMNTSDTATVYPDQQGKCSISNSSKCPELREKFMNIAGGIADAREETELMMGNLQTRCLEIERNLLQEISHYELYLRQQQAKEAAATASFGSAQQSTTKKETEQRETKKTLSEEREKCTTIEKELKNEQCALDKIRDQLLNMSNLNRHIVDCEVSVPWEYGACSTSCAGGVRTLTRDVDVQPGPGPEDYNMGHKCPLVAAQQMCNTDRCPVDCQLSDWDEWGSCSKVCDGGIRERMRRVVQHKLAAGMPCESRIEAEDCHIKSCKQDCVLSDWSAWSTTCSKQCGGGQQTSFKTLEKPAEDGGYCAHFYDESRFRKKPCNTDACPYTKAWATCRAKVDVVILLDSSASMGATGFAAAKQFASNFAKAMSAPAQVASLVFSAPPDFGILNQCEGIASGDVTIEQCGMHWASHLTSDFAAVETGISDAPFAEEAALTYLALDLAGEEFANGRQDAQSIAILLTDGLPVRTYPMADATNRLKKHARLMEVVVGTDGFANAAEFKGWGSDPWEQNVRFVADWDSLVNSNDTLNGVIEDFCADMVFEK